MKSNSETRFFKEPTQDEIALHAFLAWERDGSPQNSDQNYWFDAEARLRAQRQKQAASAAAQAAKTWPPQSRAKSVPAKKTAPVVQVAAPVKKAPMTATTARATTVKVTGSAKATAPRPVRATALRAAR